MNNKKQVYGEFVVRPYENELYHYALKHANKDFKYIRKERKNGKWRYYYDDDTAKGRVAKDSKFITSKPMVDKTITAPRPTKDATAALIKPNTGNSPTVTVPDLKNSRHRPGLKRKELPLKSKDGKAALIKPDTPSSLTKDKPDEPKERNYKNYGVDHGPAAKFQSIDEMPKKTTEMSYDEDQKMVNPDYNPEDSFYSTNCAYCSATWDLRRRGYDVEAQPALSTYDTTIDEIASWYGATVEDVYGIASGTLSTNDPKECADAMEGWLLEEGDGSYGNFIMYWNGGGAHSVVWTVENNTVMIRDTQLNTVDTYDDYMESHKDYLACYFYLRTDNRELSPAILEVARRRREAKKNDR